MGIVKEALLDGLELPPSYTVSEWADQHVVLPPELAAEPGRWRTSRVPFIREPMDCLVDPAISEIVFMGSAQVAKTSFLLNGVGYHIHHRPAPMLLIQPTLEMAEAFTKDKLDPLIAASPVLSERVVAPGSRTSGNTQRYKRFPGGLLAMTGANSPTSLRMRSVKFVWADEIDAYPAVAGQEGDPLKLAAKRSQTFWDRKLICTSTPTIEGVSRIAARYAASDQRKFFVDCPDCGGEQFLVWERVHWQRKQPQTAAYACEHCGCLVSDAEIKAATQRGRWKATAPFTGIAGFWIWQAYSPWSSLEEIVAEFEETVGKPSEHQVFFNTTLGLTWNGDTAAQATVEELLARREAYPADKVPERACVLTAGVDVQGDRIEVLIKAYGAENQQWALETLVCHGNPAGDAPWDELKEILQLRIPHPSGRHLTIEAVAIDSGYMTQKVYDFSARNLAVGRRWYAIKGQAGEGKPAWTKSDVRLKGGARLYNVGVDGLKTELYARLAVREPGPNYIHFPKREPVDQDRFNEAWFEQLIVEKVRVVYDTKGFPKREWFKPEGARNEALDINVYADAAHKSLNINHKDRLATMYEKKATTSAADVAALFM